ncbi:DUF6420 family protein [Streptomyces sp. NPDC058646]|uniref:DUF6420 family protein n=1 Tax=Streptomyces sp. NPDC058646 TaxID=3346574 RepID=UPI00365325D4
MSERDGAQAVALRKAEELGGDGAGAYGQAAQEAGRMLSGGAGQEWTPEQGRTLRDPCPPPGLKGGATQLGVGGPGLPGPFGIWPADDYYDDEDQERVRRRLHEGGEYLMTTEHRGVAGPYTEYDGLPALHATETDLPLLHPYGPVPEDGRCVTPGGGRLTVRSSGRHQRITLDHLGCPAQDTEEKAGVYRRLALAGEGHCLPAGCRHEAAHQGGILRSFEFPAGSIETITFVRALLAVELGDEGPATRPCGKPRRWPARCARWTRAAAKGCPRPDRWGAQQGDRTCPSGPCTAVVGCGARPSR